MPINIDFPLVLTLLVAISGIVSLLDIIFFAKRRRAKHKNMSKLVEYSRSFFPVLLLVWVIRSFLVQPYRVPTGSLEPTIMPGDFIALNQFAYGLRLPVANWKFVNIEEPKIGDIALFRAPPEPNVLYIKRVIGTPGDHIIYKDKVLTINGKEAHQEDAGVDIDFEGGAATPVHVKLETLPNNITHKIFVRDEQNGKSDNFDIVVPKDSYFMMGDNRDASNDSRYWGFVPEENLVGKAFYIWFSWDSEKYRVQWNRIGMSVK